MNDDQLERARRAKVRLTERYAGDARVKGIGVALLRSGGLGVRVLVENGPAADALRIGGELDGVPVEVVAVGEIRAQD